jgi:LysR family hca operon transcriptional activator
MSSLDAPSAADTGPTVRRRPSHFFGVDGDIMRRERDFLSCVQSRPPAVRRAVMLLPAYTERYLPGSITTRPVQGEVSTLDLILDGAPANVVGNDKVGHRTTS